ncbi:MAG TPA: sulfite exporter TauE/SafE family protein [Vicinamibacterales bacterium]|nr:sulfite exporter TauE/SafE family protein [Vicinamibacterales bacterium]
MTAFDALVAAAGLLAGALASIVGFGIGSLLTPVFAMEMGTRAAVALVSIPHLIGTALRFALIKGHLDRRVFLSFGLTSAAGGLTGALLHARLGNPALSIVFGLLLLFVAASELTGLARRMRFSGPVAWIAGAASGFLGGLVGNQGGIRSAALVGFRLQREAFVATATAVGLVVDAARMPVYFVTEREAMLAAWPMMAIATAGVVIGTLAGRRVLSRIPDAHFHRIVAVVLAVLGTAMLVSGLRTG